MAPPAALSAMDGVPIRVGALVGNTRSDVGTAAGASGSTTDGNDPSCTCLIVADCPSLTVVAETEVALCDASAGPDAQYTTLRDAEAGSGRDLVAYSFLARAVGSSPALSLTMKRSLEEGLILSTPDSYRTHETLSPWTTNLPLELAGISAHTRGEDVRGYTRETRP
eukprot:scaffold177993_cov41-Tisochrysis_lutea.AAC.1